MSSVYGKFFRIMTFGESHGPAIGVVVDGVTPGVEITKLDIQKELDRRKPGQSAITTHRKEGDLVEILSGVFEGKTTGHPIMLLIKNADARSKDYGAVKDLFRPGHADFTFFNKYGIRDYRGGGRASGRETATRVAAGAIAKKLLASKGVTVTAWVKRLGGVECETCDPSIVEKNPVRACDPLAAEKMIERIREAQGNRDSLGGIVECRVSGVPVGLGEPVFDKIEADLAKGMMSIGATKGVEFGAGFAAADMTGKENNDEMDANGFLTNNAGGTLGGITTGSEIVFRVAVKPTASLPQPQRTVDVNGNETECVTNGRHDPCICPRAVPVVEAMAAITVIDHIKMAAALEA